MTRSEPSVAPESSGAVDPEPPEGYRDPVPFRYSFPPLLVGAPVLFSVSLVVFGGLLWAVHGSAVIEAVFQVQTGTPGFAFTVDVARVGGALVLGVVATTVAHEAVHGLAYRLLGYDASYGFAVGVGAVYTAAFGQFQERGHTMLVALAPLFAISLLVAPLLASPVPLLSFTAFVVSVFNAVGSIGDVYVAGYLLGRPGGTLFYESDLRHAYVLEPDCENHSRT